MAYKNDNGFDAVLRRCRTHFLHAALFSGLVNILYLVPSIYMLLIYDRVLPTRGEVTLLALTVALLAALSTFAALDMIRMRILQQAGARLERLAAPALIDDALGGGAHESVTNAQVLRDFDTIRGALAGPAIIAVFDLPWTPVYIVTAALLHPLLGVLALVATISLATVAWLGERLTGEQVRAISAGTTDLYRLQDHALRTAGIGRVLGMRGAMAKTVLAIRIRLVDMQHMVARRSGHMLAVSKFLRLMFQSAALGLGAWLVIEQRMSAGAIFAASLIVGRALQPVEQILGVSKTVLAAKGALASLRHAALRHGSRRRRAILPTPTGALTVKDVTVRVAGRDRPVLDAVSFAVQPGEILAVVGASGAGKSTLQQVLAGVIVPDAGEVRIDGARRVDWDEEQIGRATGYMPQDPTLFPTSVHDNIARLLSATEGNGPGLDARVAAAAQSAGAHDMILRLPSGYATDLGQDDRVLSAGQRQSVALARALLDEPVLILLDEPNAHLDGAAESALVDTLAALKARRATVVVSTHRAALLQVVDTVLILADGKVQAHGSRDTILPPVARSFSPAPRGIVQTGAGATK